jgi:hypothetical protein
VRTLSRKRSKDPLVSEPTPKAPGPIVALGGLELCLRQPVITQQLDYTLEGQLTGPGAELYCDGGSLQIHNKITGLADEAFLATDGGLCQALNLEPNSDNGFLLALCDGLGDIAATAVLTIRHRQLLDATADLSTAVLQRNLAIGVVSRTGQRRKQILAPVGSALPGRFTCLCRTSDQCGRLVVPLWQDDRLLHQLVVNELDANLPVGAPVEVELQVEADRAMTLRVVLRQAGRSELVQLPAPPPLVPPTAAEIERVTQRIGTLLPEFTGQFGGALQEKLRSRVQALQQALERRDDEQAALLLSELEQQREQMELAKLQVQYPLRQRLTQLVKRCLYEAANVADRTGRDREQLFAPIYAQEQTAEQAHAEKNAAVWRCCFDQLRALAADLMRLQDDLSPLARRHADQAPSIHDVQDALHDLQVYLQAVLAAAQLKKRQDFVAQLLQADQQRGAVADRAKRDVPGAMREVRRLLGEVGRMEQELSSGWSPATLALEGMLEGSA